jgi:PhnB protein
MPVKPLPDGASVITPVLIVEDADRLVTFVKDVFGALEHVVARRPDGRIWHADLTIDGAHLMIADASPQFGAVAAAVNVYVPDTDATYARALAAGASSVSAPSDRFYGDRNAIVKDRSGITWSLATHVEDVPPDELKRREAAALQQLSGGH